MWKRPSVANKNLKYLLSGPLQKQIIAPMNGDSIHERIKVLHTSFHLWTESALLETDFSPKTFSISKFLNFGLLFDLKNVKKKNLTIAYVVMNAEANKKGRLKLIYG